MIPSPFPQDFVLCCKSTEDLPCCDLLPEERPLLSDKAVEVRRRHFTLGRSAAREAVASLTGQPAPPILIGEKREPLWPRGIVGAITHTGDVAMAVVAHRDATAGVGIDAEEHTREVSFGISRHICSEKEQRWVEAGAAQKDMRLKQIFSAKESIFKAFYPIEKVYLDFLDAELAWCDETRAFRGKLLKQAGQGYPVGYTATIGCQILERYVVTWTWLPPP